MTQHEPKPFRIRLRALRITCDKIALCGGDDNKLKAYLNGVRIIHGIYGWQVFTAPCGKGCNCAICAGDCGCRRIVALTQDEAQLALAAFVGTARVVERGTVH